MREVIYRTWSLHLRTRGPEGLTPHQVKIWGTNESTAILQEREKSAESVKIDKETVTHELYTESWEIETQKLHQLVTLTSPRDVEFSWQRSTRTGGSKEMSPGNQAAWEVWEVLNLSGVNVSTNKHDDLCLVYMQTQQFSDKWSKQFYIKRFI